MSNSTRKSIKIFWAQTFLTPSLPGPNFFKATYPATYMSSELLGACLGIILIDFSETCMFQIKIQMWSISFFIVTNKDLEISQQSQSCSRMIFCCGHNGTCLCIFLLPQTAHFAPMSYFTEKYFLHTFEEATMKNFLSVLRFEFFREGVKKVSLLSVL